MVINTSCSVVFKRKSKLPTFLLFLILNKEIKEFEEKKEEKIKR